MPGVWINHKKPLARIGTENLQGVLRYRGEALKSILRLALSPTTAIPSAAAVVTTIAIAAKTTT